MELVKFENAEVAPVETNSQPNSQSGRDQRAVLVRVVKQVAVLAVVALLTYGFFQFSHRHLVQTVKIVGRSMAPTLPDQQLYLLNRAAYLVREPQPKDIVVLRDPETNAYAIKRIVAKPGDSVFVQGGKLFVNGELLREPYLDRGTKTYPDGHYKAQFWICGIDQYFVLGDNRNNSADSRVYGAVPRENILGVVNP
jgi:signal peptidase I